MPVYTVRGTVHFQHKGTNYTTFQKFCLLWLALAGASVAILAGESARMLAGESLLEVEEEVMSR